MNAALKASIKSFVITTAGAVCALVATPDGWSVLTKHPTLALATVIPPIIRGILQSKGGDSMADQAAPPKAATAGPTSNLGQQVFQAAIALVTGQPAEITVTEKVLIPSEVPVLGGKTLTSTETWQGQIQ